ncbi:glycosyltransferase family 4 protein [Spirillospora sp. CA-294931]|uniref:glycosyltransferase family 4 protein n=1 Tax=Spirillospora sp. CA-294931 TaxID=3240042 RepID=UPI003D8B8C92
MKGRRAQRLAHRAVRRVALRCVRAVVVTSWRLRPRPAGGRPRVRVLLQHAYGTGGTIRTVLNVCGHLARDADVEIVSVVRRRESAFFSLPPGVEISFADSGGGGWLAKLPSLLTPGEDATFRAMSLYSDLRLVRALCRRTPDVLIGTRPSLNLLAAALTTRRVATIGQDHMNLPSYRPGLRAEIARCYGGLTVVTVLTERSRQDYEDLLTGTRTRVVRIPNALPVPPGNPSPRDRKTILAAGRLTRQKGFDLLLRAYEPLAREHPDWTLRIFGSGRKRARLRAMITELGLEGRVELRPRTPDLPGEMVRSSIFVLSSRHEGMPMVVIEAMAKGLAVVAFDCPTGPGEMITHRTDGLLVPPGDVARLTEALRELIEDPGLRDRLGEGALVASKAYDLDDIGPRWAALVAEPTTASG